MTEYFRVGKFVAGFGVKGELVLKHHLGNSALTGLKVLFVEENRDTLIPWFVENIRVRSDDEILVQLEGISSREQAAALTRKQVWMDEENFRKYADVSAPVNLLGYAIIEGDRVLGNILEVMEQPHQVLCRIRINDKDAYIPLHQETIRKIDRKKKQVIVELPPGLLEIYL